MSTLTQRTEKLTISITPAMYRRLKLECARLRITYSDVFEMGFNATFPPARPTKAKKPYLGSYFFDEPHIRTTFPTKVKKP